jgi:cation diffusion facilitator CzcD-associated flavoprotein CzcO
MRKVAIVGAGPAGLVLARYLKSEGFTPVIFEQGDSVGGQWTGDTRHSGAWASMRTNLSRVMMAFSDLRHEPDTPVYPSNQAMHAYLKRYAERFDLMSCVHFKTRVINIGRDAAGTGWRVWWQREGEAPRDDWFANVVIASGRCQKPMIPMVEGLDTFSGPGGVAHTFNYRQQEHYRSQRILIAGCSISAIEIASDLAMSGSPRVITASRRQRYVLNQLIAGVPVEHVWTNRYTALEEETFGFGAVDKRLKEFILRTSGSPEQFGAPKPAATIAEANVTISQFYLPLVAEGRIETKPWIEAVNGRYVRFNDGSVEEVDAIIFGTGFDLNLPFLSKQAQQILGLDEKHIDLYNWTFHPELPGLAFLGMMELVGPHFPVLETQARWIAYVMSGARPAPSIAEMEDGIEEWRARRGNSQAVSAPPLVRIFAREAGVQADLYQWPQLARALLFGPLSPISFRLNGRDSLPEAPDQVAEDARAFGAIPSPVLSRDECAQLQELAREWGNEEFTQFVARLPSESNLAGDTPRQVDVVPASEVVAR